MRRAAASRARGTAARPGPQWLQPLPVRDWMNRNPVVVQAEAPIAVAKHLMRTKKVRHLPVVGEGGRLVGIATDRGGHDAGDHDVGFESIAAARVTTIHPLRRVPEEPAPYDYGFAVPDSGEPGSTEGAVH